MLRPDRLITLYLVRPLHRLGLVRPAPGLPILMYHSISEAPEPGMPAYYRVNTSPKRFAEQMDFLHSAGYKGVDLETGMDYLDHSLATLQSQPTPGVTNGRAAHAAQDPQPATRNPQSLLPSALIAHHSPLATRLVVLTFDDGFADFYTEAFPVLQKHGFTATMFLPTAFIGDERRTFSPRGGRRSPSAIPHSAYRIPHSKVPHSALRTPHLSHSPLITHHFCMSWSEVRELRAAGIRFGSHTVNHPRLYDLPWARIESEIRDSKSEIESRLDAPCATFAYPYAYPQADTTFVEQFETMLGATGYRCGVTTRLGRVEAGANRLALERLPVNHADDVAFLRAKLEGAYNWLGGTQATVKRVKDRVMGRRSRNGAPMDPTPSLAPRLSPGPAGAERGSRSF